MENLEYYRRIVLAENAGLIFLCICGAILNGAMLYVLAAKKQIRASVYTAYMIQIALTDLLVCVVWLVLTCVLISELRLSLDTIASDYVPNDTEEDGAINNTLSILDNVFAAQESRSESGTSSQMNKNVKFTIWRVLFIVYNFHYYTNIFLLASMSVERCAAVWKSLRCQRYQYNRKSIYTVSIAVWILSLACVLPSFINLNLVVSESDSTQALGWTKLPSPTNAPENWKLMDNPLTHIFREPVGLESENGLNFTSLSNDVETNQDKKTGEVINMDPENAQLYKSDMEVLYECYLLLWRSSQLKKDCVENYNNILITECLHMIGVITTEYGNDYKYDDSDNPNDNSFNDYIEDNYTADGYGEYRGDYDGYNADDYGNINYLVGGEDSNLFSNDEALLKPDTMCIDRDFYQHLLVQAVEVLIDHYKGKGATERKCDPRLSNAARAYVISVNLIIGFFIPFIVIVISYVSIAYMISKRANSRMKPDIGEGHHHGHYNYNYNSNHSMKQPQSESIGRRMTNFFRQVMGASLVSEDKSYWDESGVDDNKGDNNRNARSPTSPASSGIKRKIFLKNATQENRVVENVQQSKSPTDASISFPAIQRTKKFSFGHDVTNEHIPQTIAEHPHESDESANLDTSYLITQPRLTDNQAENNASSYTPPNRRESGGSYTSSVDSFPTEQTSVNDKRLSASTTCAITPPTPLNHTQSPNVNEFFPQNDDGLRPENVQPMTSAMEQNSIEQNMMSNRPPIGRFHNVPTDTQNKHKDFGYKIFRKSLKSKSGGNKIAESSMKADQDIPHDHQPTNGKMVRSQSAPEREANRIHNRQASLKRGEFNANGSDGRLHQGNSRYHRQTSTTSSFINLFRGRTNSNISSKSHGNTMRKTVVRKNAERHLRVSRTVLAYVIVFAICWLPQRIVYLLYVMESLMDQSYGSCLKLISSTRVISFITVLLNPLVYVATQRELRAYMRQRMRKSKFIKICCGIGKRFKRKPENNEGNIETGPANATWTANQNRDEGNITGNDAQAMVPLNSIKHIPSSTIKHEDEHLMAQPLMKKINFSEEMKKQDAENKNWIERSVDSDNHKASNESSKNSSSGKEDFFFSKSENIEEFWMRWLQEKQYNAVNQQENGENSSAAAKVLAKMSEDMNETTI